MRTSSRLAPALRATLAPALLAAAAVVVLLAGPAPPAHAAKGNASAAIGFLEDAQNDDGGFGSAKGKASDPTASLWTAVALLSGGKHPLDEFNKGGKSLDGYLRGHRSGYKRVGDLGLLAIVQGAAGYGASHYGDPGGALKRKLTDAAVRADPRGAGIAVLGLLAVGDGTTATAAAQVLLASSLPDGGWGPPGLSDSESTAVVLQALAKAAVADATNDVVKRGVAYLQKAQGNDGAIMASIRTDPAAAGGSVSATAFTIQALGALGLPSLKTPTGKTVRQGLTQYQQRTTGGLSSNGSLYDSTFAPSVTETAEAFAAFNGTTFPLDSVPPSTSGPPKRSPAAADAKTPRSRHVSSGTSATGVSDTGSANTQDAGAFQRSKTGRQGTAKRGATDRKGSGGGKKAAAATGGSGGESVTGQVVDATSAPKLATRAGQDGSGLSDQTKAALGLATLLLLAAGGGGWLAARRPAAEDRSATQVALTAAAAALTRARARGALAPLATALVGLVLVAVPFATHMWDRAPQGAALVDAFAPHLQAQKVATYQRDLRDLDDSVRQATVKGPKVLYPKLSGAAAQKRFAKTSPMLAGFQAQWPQTYRSLRSVVDPIAEHRTGYEAIAALPRFTLFPWFFVVPGALLVLLGAVGLALPGTWRTARWGAVAVGAGLVLAPSAFGLWDRAPKGAAMVDAFRPVETRPAVVRVQNDFGQVAVLQGALAGELVPALKQHGYGTRELNRSFPAVQTVDRRWIQILGDLTPVIGVMSDNVTRFQAVAALPALTAFPWLFVVPGALVLLVVLLSARRGRRRRRPPATRPAPDAGPPSTDLSRTSTTPKEHLVSTSRLSRRLSALTSLALAAALTTGASDALAKKVELKGTLGISAGKPASEAQQKKTKAKYTGSYFRMILPGGTDKFFVNSDSRAKDKTYTLFRPGTAKGLRLGAFQNPPEPAFAPNGFALAKSIVRPETFAGIDFSISTAATDAQTGQPATAPRLYATGKKISGDLRAWTAEWNAIYFNQGAPKPNGSLPGFTKPVNGTYDAKSKKYAISWYSLIVGGPFNGFTGYWHLEGKLLAK